MKKMTAEVLFAMGVWAISMGGCASSTGREKVEMSAVPGPVRATLDKQAQGGYVTNVQKYTTDGKTVYEAKVINSGSTSEIRVNEDGKLVGSW